MEEIERVSQDKEYIAYCQMMLQAREWEYKANKKQKVRDRRAKLVGIPLLCLSFLGFVAFFVLTLQHPNGHGGSLEQTLSWAFILGFLFSAVLTCGFNLEPNQNAMLKAHESYPTCAEKIAAYAMPYESWLVSNRRAEKDAARSSRIREQSQLVCAALGSAT